MNCKSSNYKQNYQRINIANCIEVPIEKKSFFFIVLRKFINGLRFMIKLHVTAPALPPNVVLLWRICFSPRPKLNLNRLDVEAFVSHNDFTRLKHNLFLSCSDVDIKANSVEGSGFLVQANHDWCMDRDDDILGSYPEKKNPISSP